MALFAAESPSLERPSPRRGRCARLIATAFSSTASASTALRLAPRLRASPSSVASASVSALSVVRRFMIHDATTSDGRFRSTATSPRPAPPARRCLPPLRHLSPPPPLSSGSPPPTPSEPAPPRQPGSPRWLSPFSLARENRDPSTLSLALEGSRTAPPALKASRALLVPPGSWPSVTLCNRRPSRYLSDDVNGARSSSLADGADPTAVRAAQRASGTFPAPGSGRSHLLPRSFASRHPPPAVPPPPATPPARAGLSRGTGRPQSPPCPPTTPTTSITPAGPASVAAPAQPFLAPTRPPLTPQRPPTAPSPSSPRPTPGTEPPHDPCASADQDHLGLGVGIGEGAIRRQGRHTEPAGQRQAGSVR